MVDVSFEHIEGSQKAQSYKVKIVTKRRKMLIARSELPFLCKFIESRIRGSGRQAPACTPRKWADGR